MISWVCLKMDCLYAVTRPLDLYGFSDSGIEGLGKRLVLSPLVFQSASLFKVQPNPIIELPYYGSRVTGRVKPPTGCMTFKIKENSLEYTRAPLCLINVRLIAWKVSSFIPV